MKTSLAMPAIPAVRTTWRSAFRNAAVCVALLVVSSVFASLRPGTADAAMIVNVVQQGSDVVVDYSGSWDVWSRTDFGSSLSDLAVYSLGLFNVPVGSNYDYILGQGLTKASGHWTTVDTRPDSPSGDILAWKNTYTYAPLDYTAGNPIVGSMTFNNTDLATMGFTPGDSGSFTGTAGTVNFSVSPVPEPTSVALLVTGVAGCVTAAGIRRRRRISLVMTVLKASLC